MKTKILLISFTALALGSCTSAYKSSQTPDDVYYSPVRVYEGESERRKEEEKDNNYRRSDYEITMSIRDHRWRDFRDDYDYDYSPYNYTCKRYTYGYYYNPYYYPWAIYTSRPGYSKPVNTTPRMVNLNSYNGYNPGVASDKTNGSNRWVNSNNRYNNSNSNSRSRQSIIPNSSSSSSNNNTRTYTPSSSSGSSSGSSSSGSSSGSVSRPGRG